MIGSCTHRYQSEFGSTGNPDPLGLEAGVRHAPVEVVGERQVDAVDGGDVDRDGLGHPVNVLRSAMMARMGTNWSRPRGPCRCSPAASSLATTVNESVPPTAAIAFMGR